MKSIFLAFVLLFGMQSKGYSQLDFNDSLAQDRNHLTQNAMVALGSFGVVNIITGFAIGAQTQGQTKYFWQMNGYWNIINLGVAGLGYLGVRKAFMRKYSLAQNDKAQLAVEKTYVLNFGLDLVYITGGFYLQERGNNQSKLTDKDQYKGYGTSISCQGGFLLLLDGVMVMLHHKNSIRLNKKLSHLELNAAPGGMGVTYKWGHP